MQKTIEPNDVAKAKANVVDALCQEFAERLKLNLEVEVETKNGHAVFTNFPSNLIFARTTISSNTEILTEVGKKFAANGYFAYLGGFYDDKLTIARTNVNVPNSAKIS